LSPLWNSHTRSEQKTAGCRLTVCFHHVLYFVVGGVREERASIGIVTFLSVHPFDTVKHTREVSDWYIQYISDVLTWNIINSRSITATHSCRERKGSVVKDHSLLPDTSPFLSLTHTLFWHPWFCSCSAVYPI
jgi:hypothetical protein